MPNDDYQKWSLYEGCHGNDSICSDMDDCEKMLTDAWPIHCGPCIINVPEEFSNLELSKKCDMYSSSTIAVTDLTNSYT